MEIIKEIKKNIHVKHLIFFLFIIAFIYEASYILIALEINNVYTQIEADTFIFSNHVLKLSILLFIIIVFNFLSPYMSGLISTKADKDGDKYFVSKVLEHKVSFFNDKPMGEIINIIKNVGPEVCFYYSSITFIIVKNMLTLSCIIGILIYYNYKLTLVILALVILLTILTGIVGKDIGKKAVIATEGNSKVLNDFEIMLSNFRIISMLNKKNYFMDKYSDNYQNKYYKPKLKYILLEGLYVCIYTNLIYVLPLLTLVLGVLFKNILFLTTGTILVMYTLTGNIQEPIRQIANLYNMHKNNKENVKLLSQYIKVDKNDTNKLDTFNNLSFESNGLIFNNKVILKDIKFKIEKNDFVNLKGNSGSGKSTILKLIMHEFENNDTTIKINNIDISNLNYNSKILCVTQDTYLFPNTIYENLTLGDNYTTDELEEVINTTELKSFIEHYGFDKVIDNKDSNISGGEKQRLSIARILLRKPELLLLDEVTSSLDEQTANKVSDNIYKYCTKYNITVISISHKTEFDKYATKTIHIM